MIWHQRMRLSATLASPGGHDIYTLLDRFDMTVGPRLGKSDVPPEFRLRRPG